MFGRRGEQAPKKNSIFDRLFWVSGWIYDFSKVATLLLIIGLIIHYYVATVLVVRGASMEPNYNDGDVLLINKIRYYQVGPARGDVVAMYFPGETEKRFIKRVIGLPGETISIRSGQVQINNQKLDESYLPSETVTLPDMERTLVSGEYFVFGDNRAASSDSRAWGSVPRRFIIGKIGRHIYSLPAAENNF